jgi:hypothetical protein
VAALEHAPGWVHKANARNLRDNGLHVKARAIFPLGLERT